MQIDFSKFDWSKYEFNYKAKEYLSIENDEPTNECLNDKEIIDFVLNKKMASFFFSFIFLLVLKDSKRVCKF